MGERIMLLKSEFFLPRDKRAAALHAVHSLVGSETNRGFGEPHYSFVKSSYATSGDLIEALACWRWLAEEDEEGNIVSIEFTGEKRGDDRLLFRAIAPFVRRGSFISIACESGCLWRWYFDGGDALEQEGTVVFPD